MEVESLVTLSMDSKENFDVPMEVESMTVTCSEPSDINLASDNNEEAMNEQNENPPKNSIESNEDSQGFTNVSHKTSHSHLRAIIDSESEDDAPTNTPGEKEIDKTEVQSKDNMDQNKNLSKNSIESDEDSQGFTNVSHKTSHSRLRAIIDSESEDDTPTNTLGEKEIDKTEVQSKDNMDRNENLPKNSIESDDSQGFTNVSQKTSHSRLRAIVDSESEDDTPTNTPGKKEVENTQVQSKDSTDSEDESDFKKNNISAAMSANNLEDRYKALVDSESEDETPVTPQAHKEMVKQTDTKATKSHQKRRTGSIRASKEEAMKQIHSETQRLIRESSVSLPYHVPKQRTLEEFLNRKKVINTLPKAPTMAAKLKMSSQIVNKALEEKEKEAEKFYASSDSEEDTEERAQEEFKEQLKEELKDQAKEVPVNPSTSEVRQPGKPRIIMVESIPIEETQRLLKNVHDARNKKEILQQGDQDLGVPRKLFGQEEEEKTEIQCANTSYVPQHPSVPRKLFGFPHGSEESEKMQNEDDGDCRDDFLIIKETVAELISTVESMMQEHHEQIETPMEVTAEADAIVETPHISKEEVTKLLSKDDITSVDKTINTSATNKMTEEDTEVEIKDKVDVPYSEVTPTCTKNIKSTTMIIPDAIDIDEDEWNTDYGLSLTNTTVTSAKSKLLPHFPPIQPKLRGCPGTVIDLTQEVKPDRKGINQLIDRFFCKHSKANKPTDNSNDVTVINIKQTAEGPMPVKETLPYKLPAAVTESPELSKPGAKLVRLQQELKHQMAMKRDEEWKEKERLEKEDEEMFGEDDFEEEKGCSVPEDGSVSEKCNKEDAEDAEDAEDEEDEEDDEDLDDEMDDVYLKEKKRKSCAFADDEAEVSDGADSDDDEEADENDEDEEMELHLDEDGDEESSKDTVDAPKKRKLKRIIQAFDEDSCQSNINNDKETDNPPNNAISRKATDVDMFENDNGTDGWGSDNENYIPIAQQYITNESTSQNCLSQQTESNILALTPITQLTPLKKVTPFVSLGGSQQNDLKLSLGPMLNETPPTQKYPLLSSRQDHEFKKKIFNSNNDLSLPPTGSEKSETPKKNGFEFNNEPNVSESQLLELCSGAFTSQPIDMKELEAGDITQKITNPDLAISSQVKTTAQSSGIGSLSTQMRVLSSDEEEDDDIGNAKKRKQGKKRRKVKQLDLSDDDDNESDNEEDEEEDAEDDVEENEQFVDYDSEENEVIVVPKKDIKNYAAGFLENEAELSESDWDGSEDEDEKGLDKFEVEDGDDEDIDEEDAQKEVGKFHMKQILDEDQRDVRMLKELLFEDGDLHTDGSGRERRFRWKNIDKLGNDDNNTPVIDENDGYVDCPEDESELQWRKLRHEREKFVAEQNKKTNDDIDDDIKGSQIFQLGMRALQKSKSNQSKKEVTPTDDALPTRIQHTFTDLLDDDDYCGKPSAIQSIIRKRSILARGEASLARLAKMARQSDTSHLPMKARNFIFTTITPDEDQSQMENNQKEQETDLYSTHRKRKAFSDLNSQSSKKPRGAMSQRGQRKKPF